METIDKTPDLPKKCFCARCFLPVDGDEKVDIEGQNFHRICSMCCICRSVPKSLKTFYGHVFCTECFKQHVLSRFRGEQKVQSSSWWNPGAEKRKTRKPSGEDGRDDEPVTKDAAPQESADIKDDTSKKQICARCLQMIPQEQQVRIGGQAFHQPCARCYCCHTVPADSLKIYYGQVFCEECFNRFIINRDKDNPSEFYKSCLDSWHNNPQFAETMQEFMSSGNSASPIVFMMQGQQAPFCRCGSETPQPAEPKKCKTAALGDTPCLLRSAQAFAKGDSHFPPLHMKGLLIETSVTRQNGPLRHCSAPPRPEDNTRKLTKSLQLDKNCCRYFESIRSDNKTHNGDEKTHNENDCCTKLDPGMNSVLTNSSSVRNENMSLLDDSRSFQHKNISPFSDNESLRQILLTKENGLPQPRISLQGYKTVEQQSNKNLQVRCPVEGRLSRLERGTCSPSFDLLKSTLSRHQNKKLQSGNSSPKTVYLQNESYQTGNFPLQDETSLPYEPFKETPSKSPTRYESRALSPRKSPTRKICGTLQPSERSQRFENGTPKLNIESKLHGIGGSGSPIPAMREPRSPNRRQSGLPNRIGSPDKKALLHENDSSNYQIHTRLSKNGFTVHKSTLMLDENNEKVSLHDSECREDESLHNETPSIRSDNESIQHDDSYQHDVISETSSLIPLFQNCLEPERVMSPRRRFLRNQEINVCAVTSTPTGDDVDSWELLSINADAETYEDYSSIGNESANLDVIPDTGEQEKIEKLTQYLHRVSRKNRNKNWKMFYAKMAPEFSDSKTVCDRGEEPGLRDEESVLNGWVNIQLRNKKIVPNCPKCIWQSGVFTANSGFVSKFLVDGSGLSQ